MSASDSPRGPMPSPGETLRAYLIAEGRQISLTQAARVWAATIVEHDNHAVAIASRLNSELRKLGVQLTADGALRVVERVFGDNLASLAHLSVNETKAEPRYMLVMSVWEAEVERQTFTTFSEAITVLVDEVIHSMPSTSETALCQVTRYPSGLNIDISPYRSDNVEFVLRRFLKGENGDPVPCEMDQEDLRFASQQLLQKLSYARPTLIFNDAAVPPCLKPSYVARFYITELETGFAFARIQEATLFQIFVWFRCECSERTKGRWIVRSKAEAFRIDICWIDGRSTRAEPREVEEESPDQIGEDIWERYCDFAESIDRPIDWIRRALEVADRTNFEFDDRWCAVIDKRAVYQAMKEQNLNGLQLVRAADISEDLISETGSLLRVSPDTVLKLADVLNVEPVQILDDVENRQQWVLATTLEAFERVATEATSFEIASSFGVHPLAAALLTRARDLARRLIFESKLGLNDSPSETIRDAVFDLIAEAGEAGLLLLLSRRISFRRSSEDRSPEGRRYECVLCLRAKSG
ncbi:hypothetical protein AWB80_01264 [Caballeronia pedi]|uniref:Uncharacterized protein n=1 Tax=Caballeronia pedi TaxID=1777141 RepID=A0A157ZTF2_9BURK|nr:helix-turn-helix transcriptional regulator [Caballeronia pedi]SAK48770.1 hypothetical protein AWB80_01264 [Caballeronia pedi]